MSAAAAAQPHEAHGPWRRGWRRLRHSLQWRMVLVFLLLAGAMSLVFIAGAQRMFSQGWREAARPLLLDYIDRLAAEVAGPPGQPPSTERARAIAQRLPVTIQIDGPVVRWSSHPAQRARAGWSGDGPEPGSEAVSAPWPRQADQPTRVQLLQRRTADGHTIRFGIDDAVFAHRPRLMGGFLAALLLLTLLAWLVVRHLLQPLEAIAQGARRFGRGDFGQAIPVRGSPHAGELGELADTLNTMGRDIQRMLDAKRALLLAISHELRSPLTRARLHAELLPDAPAVQAQRDALLRDLQEMANLVSDLLESERLSDQHAALQVVPTDLAELARSVLQELAGRHGLAAQVRLTVSDGLPPVPLDPARVRLLLRNLLDNACRHAAGAALPPELHIGLADGRLHISVRDHGPGVSADQLGLLAQAFYRPDSARTRSAGGVGLGLYLCRLVAEAHGGQLALQDAQPGLQVVATWPVTTVP